MIALGKDTGLAIKRFHEAHAKPRRAKSQLMRDLALEWLSTYVSQRRNKKGARLARARVTLYFTPHFGGVAVHRVTAQMIRTYALTLSESGLSNQTIKHVLSDCRCLLGWCVDAGYIDVSPFPRRVMPRIEERAPDRLSAIEVERVACVPDPWGRAVRFGLASGLRWSEMCRAQVSDIVEGTLLVSHTKTGRVRRVPLDPSFLAELANHTGRVIAFEPEDVSAFNRKVRRLSGVEGFHAHQLRHTFACEWLERGGTLHALQQLLGHATVVTTQRYARLSDEAVRAEANRIYRATQRTTRPPKERT